MKDYTQKTVYIGIDVHKKTYTVTAICGGIVIKRDTIAAYPEQLVSYIKKYFNGAIVYTVYEAGFSGFYLHRHLLSQGINNIVTHPGSIKVSARDRVKTALERIKYYYGTVEYSCGDRGFNNKSNDSYLKANNIYNATCPRDPKQLQEKLKDPIFLSLQTRRSQTEGRIGIFKNVFLGSPLRSRITAYKRQAINWCVLTHNLWVLSRKALDIERAMLQKAA